MTRTAPILATLSLGLGTACLRGADDGFRDVLPDDRVLVQFPTASPYAKDAEDGEWSQAWIFTAAVTDSVNGLIGVVLYSVDQVTQTPPSYLDAERNHAAWGPWADALDPVESSLHVVYDPESDSYTWSLLQKPRGAEDEAYVPVVAGEVDPGSTREAYSGRFAIDFTTINHLDPTKPAVGLFVSEYAVDGEQAIASAGFEGYTDGGEAIDALYHYEQVVGGEGSMDLDWLADSVGGPIDELHTVHARWTAEGAGRADAVLTGGELGSDEAQLSECWSTDFDAVYRSESWNGLEAGDQGLCAFDEAEYALDD